MSTTLLDSAEPSSLFAQRKAEAQAHARLLAVYIGTALLFMLIPGTFLGVWNLVQVSERQSVSLVSDAWLQAHGHAQVFGWVATFILGIGLYSIPVVRPGATRSLGAAWTCWALWTSGVTLRWFANVYGWHWRILVPLSAGLELAAFLIFFVAMSDHRKATDRSRGPEIWVKIVMTASVGFALTLLVNAGAAAYVAWRGESPAIPHALNQRFLTLMAWGFLAPFVWAFSTKWLPVLLGLRPIRNALLATGVATNVLAVGLTLAGWGGPATFLFVAAAIAVAVALRIFEPSAQPPKIYGVHPTFPLFIRLAYAWLIVAAALAVAAARWDVSGGIWGASRHAFTVGFVSGMVFSIGQRVLPAFAAAAPLWSPRLMFAGLLLLTIGCAARVSSEIIAYQQGALWAWSFLPVSAILEMAAVTAFGINLLMTFVSAPSLSESEVRRDAASAG